MRIDKVALRKLLYLHRAQFSPISPQLPGHHLEALRGDREGRHSIRINLQCQICFRWEGIDAFEV